MATPSVAPAAVKPVVTETDPRKLTMRVIVNRLNMAEEDQHIEIVVNDIGIVGGRKSFYPGQEVVLTHAQISILKEAVQRDRIDIPLGSGVYESDNPAAAARQANPGFTAKLNQHTGMISLERTRPNYVITAVDSVI